MLKYLQMVDSGNFSIFKIFKSVDVKDKKALIHTINVYADGFFGKNEDFLEDLKTNDAVKRITDSKVSNNNCFFKCIQSYVPSIKDNLRLPSTPQSNTHLTI